MRVVVGVNGQAIEARQLRRIQVFHPVGVNELDAFGRQHRLQLLEAICGAMMFRLSAEEEHSQPLGRVGRVGGRAAPQLNSEKEG
jgi:hypothetical protein